jgi:large subunit ribosomal protein L25
MSQLEVICLPKDLPEYIEVDISSLHVGQSIHLADLILPAGVELEILVSGGDADQAVVSVQPPQAEEVEKPAAAAAAAPAAEPGKTGA